MAAGNEIPQVEVGNLTELRAWLEAHHASAGSVWLVTGTKSTGERYIAWPDLVDELLVWGWIDSLPRALDRLRTMHLISKRKAGSGWSAINRAKIERLSAEGRMMPAGLEAVARAKADGSWAALNAADPDHPPDDFSCALAAHPEAERFYARFPRSSRRAILEWITLAKSAETRARRISETVRLAAENRKANHPKGRDLGPKPPA
jgi:uncharacterized protein YdeI (YjbR/CyaY-like superfamily)